MEQLWDTLVDVRSCCEVVHAPSVERSLRALRGPMRPCSLIVQRGIFDADQLEAILACAHSQGIPWAIASKESNPDEEAASLTAGAKAYLPLDAGQVARARVGRLIADCFQLAKLQQSQRVDALTKLPNQRAFEQIAKEALTGPGATNSPVALMRIDLDHFKAYNKSQGHLAGDDVLRTVARLLERALAKVGGALGRLGGQEFVALLPNAGRETAMATAASIRMAVRNASIDHPSSPDADVLTATVGLCAADPAYEDGLQGLLDAAGRALITGKDAGRDQVVEGQPRAG